MTKLTTLATIGALLALVGCVNIGDRSERPAVVYYVLDDSRTAPGAVQPGAAEATSASALPREADAVLGPVLLVLDPVVRGFYDTDQLIFSRSAGTRGQYQFARWTERPGKRIGDLLRARLEREGSWRVSAGGGYVRGDLLLDTELVELYHDAAHEPGVARLVLRASLIDMKARGILARREFVQAVPLATYDAKGAAEASGVATAHVLDELTAWISAFR
ncbi:MAG TPA: ABC-type transport auxiliary lipoprotein family protein [Thiobacillaceae bacterium]|nr:ABC-type transport auxiliary lipoprotein family protein [Thiobacillaceae bacterium]